MVTIGDVFSVVSLIFAICISTWALLLGSALLFRQRTDIAQQTIENRPWKSFFVGFALLLVVGTLGMGMVANPNPAVKLLGTFIVLGLLSIAAIGAAGLSQLIGARMQPMDPSLSAYRAIGRGAMIVVVAGLLPLVGWWVFTPIVLSVSLGAGLSALNARRHRSLVEAA